MAMSLHYFSTHISTIHFHCSVSNQSEIESLVAMGMESLQSWYNYRTTVNLSSPQVSPSPDHTSRQGTPGSSRIYHQVSHRAGTLGSTTVYCPTGTFRNQRFCRMFELKIYQCCAKL